jgi:hypothetical protein
VLRNTFPDVSHPFPVIWPYRLYKSRALTRQPEYPHNARILTQPQRDLAVWRLEQEAGVGEAHEEGSHTKAFLSAMRVCPYSLHFVGGTGCSLLHGRALEGSLRDVRRDLHYGRAEQVGPQGADVDWLHALQSSHGQCR